MLQDKIAHGDRTPRIVKPRSDVIAASELVRVLAGPLSTEHTNARVNGVLPELRRCVAAQTSAKALEVTLTVEVTAAGRVDAVTAQLDSSEAVELGESERAIGRCANVLLESWQFAAAERGSTFEIAFTSE